MVKKIGAVMMTIMLSEFEKQMKLLKNIKIEYTVKMCDSGN